MKARPNITPRQEALAERKLCSAVAALETAEEVQAFFRDLCTPAELQAMADRWAVVDLLKRELPYREIHRLSGVSVTTIGRVGSNAPKAVVSTGGGFINAMCSVRGNLVGGVKHR